MEATIFVLDTSRTPHAYEAHPVRMFDRAGKDYAGDYLASEWKNLGLISAAGILLTRVGYVEYVANSPAHLARVFSHVNAVAAVNRRIEGLTPEERERYAEELDVASIGGGCSFWEMPTTAGRVLDRIYQQRRKSNHLDTTKMPAERRRFVNKAFQSPFLEGSWVDELTDFPPRVTLRWRCRKDGGATHVHGRKGMDLRPIMKCPNCGGVDWYVDKSTTRKEDGSVKTKFWGKPTPKIVAYGTPRGGRDWTRFTSEMLRGTKSSPLPGTLVVERVDVVTTKEELAESLRKKFVPGRKFATWDAAQSRRAEKELRAVRAQLVKKAEKLKEAVRLLHMAKPWVGNLESKRTIVQWFADLDKDPER